MTTEQSFEEIAWQHSRMGRFTGSQIHQLFISGRKKEDYFGTGAMTYIRTKLAERLTMETKEQVDFKQAEWGKNYEPDACKHFEKWLGRKGTYYGVANPQFFEYGANAGCSPDWLGNDEGADFKCPYNTAEHIKNLFLTSAADIEREHYDYYCQGQMLMVVKNLKRFHFVSYDPRMIESKYRMKVITCYPDAAWVEEFKERLERAVELLDSMEKSLSIAGAFIAEHDTNLKTTLITKA